MRARGGLVAASQLLAGAVAGYWRAAVFLPYTWLFNWLWRFTPAHGVRGPWRKTPCNMVMIDGLSAEYAPGHRQNRRARRRGGRPYSCWRFSPRRAATRRATSSCLRINQAVRVMRGGSPAVLAGVGRGVAGAGAQ